MSTLSFLLKKYHSTTKWRYDILVLKVIINCKWPAPRTFPRAGHVHCLIIFDWVILKLNIYCVFISGTSLKILFRTMILQKIIFFIKSILIQPSEVQKPETGQKTGPRTTMKILCANEPVCQKKFSYINFFSIRPSEVQKPETGQKTGPQSGKFFSAEFA